MSYYLLIILNLALELLIAICILFWVFVFQFHPLEFNFYINLGPRFYNCYLLFSYHFLIKVFYLSNLILVLLIVTYFIWNNNNYFNLFIFQFFYLLELISIILIIIYFIWDNLWNFIHSHSTFIWNNLWNDNFFFQFHSHSTF